MNILLVTARYPWPARRGDQLRTAQMLELLAPEHRLTLLTPAPAAGQPPPPRLPPGTEVVTYRAAHGPALARRALAGALAGAAAGGLAAGALSGAAAGVALGAAAGAMGGAGAAAGAGGMALALASGLPLQSGLFSSRDLGRQLRRLAPRADLAILQLVRLAGHRKDVGSTPLLIDLVDDLALNFTRRAAFDRRWLRPALALEAALLGRAQRWLAGEAAGVLLVCERDRREMVRRLPAALAGRVATAALAVEAGPPVPETPARPASPPLSPAAAAARHDAAAPPRLVFTGNLGYFVNADAICWWLREVWPAVAARRPDLQLVVAGDRPAPAVRRAVAHAAAAGRPASGGGGGPAVALVESAPDLHAVLASAAAALAPMRGGSGVPVKILEAWSAGVPVVASPWAAAGTTGVPGEDLLVAQSAAEWVGALLTLLDDPAARRRLAANGRRRLAADYSRACVKGQLLAAVAMAAAAGA